MYIKVTKSMFMDAFEEHRKSGAFSYEGLKALYNHLTMLEDDIGQEMELDVYQIWSNYGEYKDKEDLFTDYPSLKDFPENRWCEYVSEIIHLKNGGYIVYHY